MVEICKRTLIGTHASEIWRSQDTGRRHTGRMSQIPPLPASSSLLFQPIIYKRSTAISLELSCNSPSSLLENACETRNPNHPPPSPYYCLFLLLGQANVVRFGKFLSPTWNHGLRVASSMQQDCQPCQLERPTAFITLCP